MLSGINPDSTVVNTPAIAQWNPTTNTWRTLGSGNISKETQYINAHTDSFTSGLSGVVRSLSIVGDNSISCISGRTITILILI